MKRVKVLLAGLLIFLLSVNAYAVTLEFNAAVPGTIADANGLGTGFTHRLPGTGGAIPTNDPNMDLLSSPGHLLLTSTNADIQNSVNVGQLEAPGLFVPNVGIFDFSTSALFRNVQVPNGSDQLLLYAGTSATNSVRAGFHELEVYLIVENQGSGDVRPFLSGFNAFTPGDDVILAFGRTSGLWSLSWQNLTTPANSGSSPGISIPWLDLENDLYAGIMASNAGTVTSFVGEVDWFTVQHIPEPSSLLLAAVGLLGCTWRRRR